MKYENFIYYYYHRDHQGSIIALSNEEGNIVESIEYDGHYGVITKHIKHEETHNPYGYTGRETDMEDLYYYRARYYDPQTQRFLSRDPIEFEAGDFNFYRYVGNDCVNFRDPSGLWTAVITNGPTTTMSNLGNPFGHSAIAFSDSGIYSFGNETPIGSSLTDYLLGQSPKRDT